MIHVGLDILFKNNFKQSSTTNNMKLTFKKYYFDKNINVVNQYKLNFWVVVNMWVTSLQK
jgi:hypothetical protein